MSPHCMFYIYKSFGLQKNAFEKDYLLWYSLYLVQCRAPIEYIFGVRICTFAYEAFLMEDYEISDTTLIKSQKTFGNRLSPIQREFQFSVIDIFREIVT